MSVDKKAMPLATLGAFALFCACDPGTHEIRIGHSEHGLSSEFRPSPSQSAQYRADQQYIHGLTKSDQRIRLNLADQRQYRFVTARLALAGKTPANSPALFEAIEAKRQSHIDSGYGDGLLPASAMALESTADRSEMHFIETASMGETTLAPNDGVGTASSTFPDGTFYTYVDTSYADEAGLLLGNMGWVEQFDGGYNATVNTVGDLGLTNLKRYVVASYKVDYSMTGFADSYVYTELGVDAGPMVTQTPTVSTPTVQAPLDHKFNDNVINVCLNRTWTQDCDYDLTGNPQAVKLPLQGSVSITSNHVFDTVAIDSIRADLNAGVPRPDAGQVKLVLTNVGGGCDVTDGATLEAKMSQFWNNVTLLDSDKTLSWNLNGNNAAFFDDGCRQVQDRAKLTMRVTLPMLLAGVKYRSSVTLSNDPSTHRPDYDFKNIEITNSCLAAGSLIQLADGSQVAIEDLATGAHVFNPYHLHSQSLTVTDTAVGFEAVPMVRIEDESGRSLLMTEMHPIEVVGRGMVQAKALRAGDVVMTTAGASELVDVRREAYDGKVYNLKVGSEIEQSRLGVDQTVVYANGFLVGDGQIQRKHESITMTEKDGDILNRLPKAWHGDYLMSASK